MENKEVSELINLLKEERNSKTFWIQRKETAAWTSAVFFITLLGLFYNFIITQFLLNIFSKPIYNFSSITLILLLLFWIFFKFIHAQFAALYYETAKSWVHDEIIFDLINKKSEFLEKINSFKDLHDYRHKLILQRQRDDFQKFIGHWHPFLIGLYFWKYIPVPIPIIYFIILIIECIYPEFKDKDEKKNKKIWYKTKKLNTLERQEAALYSLLFLTIAILGVIVYYLLFLKNGECISFIDLNKI